MVWNLQLLFQRVHTTTIDRYGSLKDWINEASDEKYWTALVQCLLHSDASLPEQLTPWGPTPCCITQVPPTACSATHGQRPWWPRCCTTHNTTTAMPPHLAIPTVTASHTTPYNATWFWSKKWLNDPVLANKVGQSMSHALKLLGLELGASEMEVKICYRQLAREYHPDKYNQEMMGLTVTEASDFFKLFSNSWIMSTCFFGGKCDGSMEFTKFGAN